MSEDMQMERSTNNDLLSLEKQAQSGNVKIQLRLGAMYRDGQGVTRDSQKSFYWFLQAAKSGNVPAQIRVAKMLEQGVGTNEITQKLLCGLAKRQN